MEQEAPYEIPDQDPKDWPPYGEVKFEYYDYYVFVDIFMSNQHVLINF